MNKRLCTSKKFNTSYVLYTKFFKNLPAKTHNHYLSLRIHAQTQIYTSILVYIPSNFFWIMREWLKSPFSNWKSWGKFSPSITQHLNGKKIIISELTDDWNSMRDCLLLSPKMEKKGKRNRNCMSSEKNCFWIVVVNSIMLCDSSHLCSSRLY